jgi:hypothetical protein
VLVFSEERAASPGRWRSAPDEVYIPSPDKVLRLPLEGVRNALRKSQWLFLSGERAEAQAAVRLA